MSRWKAVALTTYLAAAVGATGLSTYLDQRFQGQIGLTQSFHPESFRYRPLFRRATSDINLDFLEAQLDLPRRHFAVRWSGVWYLRAAQTVDIYLGADDHAAVRIDDEMVISRRAQRRTRSRRVSLDAGFHRLNITHRQEGGGYHLFIGWAPAGEAARPFDPDTLFPDEPDAGTLTTAARLRAFRTLLPVIWLALPLLLVANVVAASGSSRGRQEPNAAGRESWVILWWVVGIFVLYLATAPVVADLAGQAASVAPIWTPQVVYPIWSRPVLLLFGLSGVAIALFVPAAAWAAALAGRRLRAASLFHRAFVLNLIQATAFVSVWKAFADVVPSRPVFIAWQALVAAIGLVVMHRARQTQGVHAVDRSRPLLIGGLVLLVLLPTLLWGKTFVEDSSGDGNEAFEFSRSLATHQLPYWDLENGHYGFYPQFMLFAYPTQLTFIAIGETEAAQRLPVFFYLLGIYVVLAELARRGRRRLSGTELLLLVGAAVFFLVFHAHHSTYGVTSDLAQPTGVDTFFTFLAASAFYALVARQRAWWAISALFGSMSLAAGVPFALLFLLGHVVAAWPRLRWTALRTHVLDAVVFLVPWIGYQLFVSIYSRFHPLGVTKWSPRNLLDLRFDFDPTTALVFVATFAIVVAVVPCVSLAFVGRRDRIVRMLGVPVIGYLVVLVVFGRVHRAVSMRLRQPDSAFTVATPRGRRGRSSDPEGSHMACRSPQAGGRPA